MFSSAVLTVDTKISKQILYTEQKLVKNPNWRDSDQLAIYKAWVSWIWEHQTQIHLETFASSVQTIATFPNNISQHYWAQHDATCCDMLSVENWTSAHARVQHSCASLAKRLRHNATSTNVAWNIWPVSDLSQQHPTSHNILQHLATRWPNARNKLRPIMLRYVALKCRNGLAGPLKAIPPIQLFCF